MAGNISSKMRGKEESLGDDPKKTEGAWEETVGVLIRCSQFSQGSRWRGHLSLSKEAGKKTVGGE